MLMKVSVLRLKELQKLENVILLYRSLTSTFCESMWQVTRLPLSLATAVKPKHNEKLSCWDQRLRGSKKNPRGKTLNQDRGVWEGKTRNSILLEQNAQLSKLQLQHTINKGTCKGTHLCKRDLLLDRNQPHPFSPTQTEKTLEINVDPLKRQDGLDEGSCLLRVIVAGFAFPTSGMSAAWSLCLF